MSDDLSVPAFLDRRGSTEVANFKPEEAKKTLSQADAIIEHAARVKDWTALEMALEGKLDEQAAFVSWWRENVRGKGAKANGADQRYFQAEAEKQTGISHQQVSKWAKRLENRDAYREALFNAAYRKGMGLRGSSDQRGASGTGENDWHTPDKHLAAARAVLGEFDLDPASSDAAQERVQATQYLTPDDDGLSVDWVGRIWLNPPYAQPLIAQFVSKLVAERRAGNVTDAILLTHNYTDTAWFNEAAHAADAICFTRGRVQFINANGEIAAPTQGQAFFYFGARIPQFWQAFHEIGHVWLPYRGG